MRKIASKINEGIRFIQMRRTLGITLEVQGGEISCL